LKERKIGKANDFSYFVRQKKKGTRGRGGSSGIHLILYLCGGGKNAGREGGGGGGWVFILIPVFDPEGKKERKGGSGRGKVVSSSLFYHAETGRGK